MTPLGRPGWDGSACRRAGAAQQRGPAGAHLVLDELLGWTGVPPEVVPGLAVDPGASVPGLCLEGGCQGQGPPAFVGGGSTAKSTARGSASQPFAEPAPRIR